MINRHLANLKIFAQRPRCRFTWPGFPVGEAPSLCAVNLVVNGFTGGGDTFDCYKIGTQQSSRLSLGTGFESAWVVERGPTGVIGWDQLETYTVGGDVSALNDGIGFTDGWSVQRAPYGWGGIYSGVESSASDDFESYTDGDTIGGLDGSTGWNGPWGGGSSDTYTSPTPDPNGSTSLAANGRDDFESYVAANADPVSTPTGTLDYTGWADFDVVQGKVDLLGMGFKDVYPGHGLYMHLGGGGAQLAIVKTKARVWLYPSKSFSVAVTGSQYNPNASGSGLISVILMPEGQTPSNADWVANEMAWFGRRGSWLSDMVWYSVAAGYKPEGYYNVWMALRSTPDKYCGPFIKTVKVLSYGGGLEELSATVGNENMQPVPIQPTDPSVTAGGTGWAGAWVFNPPALADVTASPEPSLSDTFPMAVTLTHPAAGVSIHYTLNGATPTSGSTLYTGPITLSAACTLKAIAIKPYYQDSAVLSKEYPMSFLTTGLLMHINVTDPATLWKDTARTIPAAVGDTIKGVTDKSGAGRHWSQGTTAAAPVLVDLGGGKRVLRFDTTQTQYMNFPAFTTARTVFWAVAEAAGYAGGYAFLLGDPSACNFHGDSPHGCFLASPPSSIASLRIDKADVPLGTARPTSLKVVTATTNANSTASEFSRDRSNAYGARSWPGDLALLLVYDTVLTAQQISNNEDVIKSLLGI
jgi:hypothetical protein